LNSFFFFADLGKADFLRALGFLAAVFLRAAAVFVPLFFALGVVFFFFSAMCGPPP
jgi:hypothetical protein